MAIVEYGGKRHTLPAGDMLVGSGAECHLRLEVQGIAPRHAVLTTSPDLSVAIRKFDESVILEVNGVVLGPMPHPLQHGDKITLGGVDLLFADERKSGSTQYISALKLPPIPDHPKPAAPGKATTGTGGRLVCLTDGREYQVIGSALTMGRDAKADVVVTGGQVSRRHAEIVATPRGYIFVDYSTNGSWVNGERVENQRLLARADIIRLGEEEFRFYADAAPAAPVTPAPAPAPQPPAPAHPQGGPMATIPPPKPIPVPTGPPPAPYSPAQLAQTGFTPSPILTPAGRGSPRTGEDVALPSDIPTPVTPVTPVAAVPPPAPPPPPPPPPAAPVAAAPAPPPRVAAPAPPPAAPAPTRAAGPPALAKFVVRSGAQKGERLLVKVPIVNIGRADYNDLVVADESVSSQHAKLTRREGVWILTDLGSTNGTMVDGERLTEDTPLAPGCFVRFGDVQLVFEPTDDDAGVNMPKATRAMQAVKMPLPPAAPAAAPPPPPPPPPAAPPAEPPEKKKGWFPFVIAALILPASAVLDALSPLLR